MGIPKTLMGNSLPYTFSFGSLIERAKEKSIPYKDTGKKNSHLWKTGKRIKPSPAGLGKINFKFHFYRGRRNTNRQSNMNNTSNVTNLHNGHEFVDLGLPSGLLWATCNVGADSPEQAGLYFAWGLYFDCGYVGTNNGIRYFGFSVRGVCER